MILQGFIGSPLPRMQDFGVGDPGPKPSYLTIPVAWRVDPKAAKLQLLGG